MLNRTSPPPPCSPPYPPRPPPSPPPPADAVTSRSSGMVPAAPCRARAAGEGANGLKIVVDLAHDLRSRRTCILFLAEPLQRGQSGTVSEMQRRQLALIYGAALGLSSVASDLIELARGGDELVEKQPVPFSVAAALESVRDIVRPIAEEKQLAVRVLPPTRDHRLRHPVAP